MATYKIPQSAAASDKYDITIKEEGQVDSIQSVKTMLDGIGDALILKRDKAELISRGAQAGNNTYDNYQGAYVTSLHSHPTPESVPYADEAGHAATATRADSAAEADKLAPGCKINGHDFTGAEDIVITAHDIERVPKVYWGTVEPSQYSGFVDLQNGDLYVKVFG